MLAVQNEANAISARISGKNLQELTKERSKNPRDKGIQLSPGSALGALRKEYGAALDIGGVEGRIRALAVSRVCEGMGDGVFDQVVDPHRKQIYHDAIETAQRLQAALFTVPGERSLAAMAHNPFDGAQDRQRRIGTYSATRKGMRVGSTGPLFPNQKRKPLWK